jgi:hypothetical protein
VSQSRLLATKMSHKAQRDQKQARDIQVSPTFIFLFVSFSFLFLLPKKLMFVSDCSAA